MKKKIIKTNKHNKYFLYFKENNIATDDFKFYNIDKLSKLKNNSVDSLFIQDLLEYHHDIGLIGFINGLADKLVSGGTLLIQGVDVLNLSASLIHKQIDINTFKSIVLSGEKKNIFSLGKIVKILNQTDRFIITQKKFINGIQYYVECKKI